jgi:hypothetical protein
MTTRIIASQLFIVEAARRWILENPKAANVVDGRIEKAKAIALNSPILEIGGFQFEVVSQADPNKRYRVDTKAKTCTCPDYSKRLFDPEPWLCKHRLAVQFMLDAEQLDNEVAFANNELWNEPSESMPERGEWGVAPGNGFDHTCADGFVGAPVLLYGPDAFCYRCGENPPQEWFS